MKIRRAARSQSNFARLAPYLDRLFDIARETAELLGYKDHIYDPLIDLFEEGATKAQAQSMFDALKGPIRELVELASEQAINDTFLFGEWDAKRLVAFAEHMAETVGFDFNRGRIDLTTNAFCSNFSRNDVRLTTRSDMHIGGILFSSLHEMGHGLYEQNSPQKWDRTPLAGGTSLGVHESQSRTWENIVGRSHGFWQQFHPELVKRFPALKGHSTEAFYHAINKVEADPIRIGSDELNYNLHILVRFELECEVLERSVAIKELPEAWNEKYRKYLGVLPKNDGEGCLQDVHWSRGSVGYFPTYSMGNMIGWQIWRRLQKDIPDTEAKMAEGNFSLILEWLTDNVYAKAKTLYAARTAVQSDRKAFWRRRLYRGDDEEIWCQCIIQEGQELAMREGIAV